MNYLQMPCKRLETCLSANSKLCRKLFSLVPTMFDDNLRVTSIAFFDFDFNLLSCEPDNFALLRYPEYLTAITK